MGIQGGVENLQWLLTATFVAMLVAVPLFARSTLAGGAHPLHRLVYGFFCLNLLLFAALFLRVA